jgi:hypothetical protein
MPNDKWEKVKDNVRKISDTVGLTEPNSHWIPIAGKEYDEMHPAIRSRRSGDRAEHLKQFSLGNPSNVVHIDTARANRVNKRLNTFENNRFDELKGE